MALLKKSPPPAAPVTVPSLSVADPDYATFADKRSALLARQHHIDVEVAGLRDLQYQRLPDGGRAERVGALLGDEPAPISDRPSKIAELLRERADIDAALAELERRMATARHRASAKICADIKGTYQQLVANLADALLATRDAHARYLAIVDQLNANDVAWTGTLHPMQPRFLGDARDKYSPIALWLREAVANDFIDLATLPEEIARG